MTKLQNPPFFERNIFRSSNKPYSFTFEKKQTNLQLFRNPVVLLVIETKWWGEKIYNTLKAIKNFKIAKAIK